MTLVWFHAIAVMRDPFSCVSVLGFFHLACTYRSSLDEPRVLPMVMATRAWVAVGSTQTCVACASGARESSTSDTARRKLACAGHSRGVHAHAGRHTFSLNPEGHVKPHRVMKQCRTWLGAHCEVIAQQDSAAGDHQEALGADSHARGAPLASAHTKE